MINRQYLIGKIKEHTNETKITYACNKLSKECDVDSATIYRFTKFTIPNEQSLVRILRVLRLDLDTLFNIQK